MECNFQPISFSATHNAIEYIRRHPPPRSSVLQHKGTLGLVFKVFSSNSCKEPRSSVMVHSIVAVAHVGTLSLAAVQGILIIILFKVP